MAVNPRQLVAPQQLTASAATYYTSTSIRTRIDKVTVTNPTGTARTVTIYLIPSAGSAGNSTTITSAHSVAAGETWNCPDLAGHVMESGDALQALASSATALTIAVSGVQVS